MIQAGSISRVILSVHITVAGAMQTRMKMMWMKMKMILSLKNFTIR